MRLLLWDDSAGEGDVSRLSVVIVTKNEEARIRDCLESVRWAGEIIIVDACSEDRTVEICREYTKVYKKVGRGTRFRKTGASPRHLAIGF